MASDDPDFERKAADIIGLYLNRPQHAAVFCVDEKSTIQALDRLDPVLPMSPGRIERHGFEYYRHGTLPCRARCAHGRGSGQDGPAAYQREVRDFLGQAVGACPPQQEIHVILDNLSAHKTTKVQDFLNVHPHAQLHFTPTYSSWLNQVEIWFGRIQREVIARGVFTSVRDLARKLMRYIRAYSRTAHPFNWKYANVRRRVPACQRTHHDRLLVPIDRPSPSPRIPTVIGFELEITAARLGVAEHQPKRHHEHLCEIRATEWHPNEERLLPRQPSTSAVAGRRRGGTCRVRSGCGWSAALATSFF
jgi:hypothetical protein